MVQQLATPRFWIPGWRQVFVFLALFALGLVAWVLGTPSVAAPLLGEPFYERAYGFPFYFGAPLYALLSLLAGFFFPRCFYLWGIALLLPFLVASIAHALWQDLALGLDIVRGGAFGWASFVFVVVMMAVGYGMVATVLSALGAGLRLLASYGTDRMREETV